MSSGGKAVKLIPSQNPFDSCLSKQVRILPSIMAGLINHQKKITTNPCPCVRHRIGKSVDRTVSDPWFLPLVLEGTESAQFAFVCPESTRLCCIHKVIILCKKSTGDDRFWCETSGRPSTVKHKPTCLGTFGVISIIYDFTLSSSRSAISDVATCGVARLITVFTLTIVNLSWFIKNILPAAK